MDIEFEATFPDIDKIDIRKKLKDSGADLVKEEFLQRRVVFHLPKSNEISGGWIRVRDEGDKITMSLKVVDGNKIHDQKEICLKVDDLDQAELFLKSIGCKKKAYQESKRELWRLDDVDITIDEWPFLEPFLEVEGKSEESVKEVCKKIGLSYNEAMFCAVDTLYSKKYDLSEDIINHKTPLIVFDNENPFLKK